MKSGKKDVLYFLQEVDDQLIYHACILGNMQESDKEKAYYMCISKLLKFINYVHVFMFDSHNFVLSKRQLMLSMFQYHYSCSIQLPFNGT